MAKYCGNCGNEIENNETFCTNCGTSTVVLDRQNVIIEKKNTNGFAIAGFVCSFFFAILGFIFSIVGLSNSDKLNGSGKGLAVAGLCISIARFFLIIVVIGNQ